MSRAAVVVGRGVLDRREIEGRGRRPRLSRTEAMRYGGQLGHGVMSSKACLVVRCFIPESDAL